MILTLLARMAPREYLTATVASVQTLCGILELLLAIWLLRRKIGPLGIRRALISLVTFLAAAVPATAAGWGVYVWSGGNEGWMLSNVFVGAVGTALICATAGAIYLGILAALRTPELTTAVTLVRARLGRG